MSLFTELNMDSLRHKQPEKIKTLMKDHQLAMVHAMITHEKTAVYKKSNNIYRFNIGILCDSVGSGKSLSMLGLVASGQNVFPIEPKYGQVDIYKIKYLQITTNTHVEMERCESKQIAPILIPIDVIIVAHTIVKQWETYIKNDTTLKYLVVSSKKTMNTLLLDDNKSVRSQEEIMTALKEYDIILVSATRLEDFRYSIKPIYGRHARFNRVIIDEADSIKVKHLLPSRFIWYMTSSFNTLQSPYGTSVYKNANGEMSSSYSWNNFNRQIVINTMNYSGHIRDEFSDMSKFSRSNDINSIIYFRNNSTFVSNSFQLAPPIITILKCINPTTLNVLDGIINGGIISLVNAGDISGAIEKFTGVKSTETNLISIVTRDLQIELDNELIKYEMKMKLTYTSSLVKKITINKCIERQKELKHKIQMITDRLIRNNQCPICYDEPVNSTITECCKTKFCFECITLCMNSKPSCPQCRAKMNMCNIIVSVPDDAAPAADLMPVKENVLLEKITVLKNTIDKIYQKNSNSKILIFTEHETIYSKIEPFLIEQSLTYSRVMGSAVRIDNILTTFKQESSNDKLDILLLNSRHCGSGLNIENATDVIIYHSMTPELEMQVIGRAQRPGRTSVLNIWKLLNENEI
jgi:SNF2 family DNA or RNA helicase